MTKPELIAYLKEAAALEQDVYTMDEMETALEQQKKTPQRRTIREPESREPKLREVSDYDVNAATEVATNVLIIIGLILGVIISIPIFRWWTLLLGLPCGALLAWIFQALNKASTRKNLADERQEQYETEMAQYKAGLAEYRQATVTEARRYAQEKAYCDRFNIGLDQQLTVIRDQISKTKAALQKLYGLNIVYPKYRTIVPVTMFCEYMESGRCETLDGADGAYNKYEEELRMELIIGNLGSIKSVLDDIRSQVGRISGQLGKIQQNQYLLYQELREGNRIAADIANTAAAIAQHSASIAQSSAATAQSNAAIAANTAWTAYSAAATARNTRAIAHCAESEHTQKYVLTP